MGNKVIIQSLASTYRLLAWLAPFSVKIAFVNPRDPEGSSLEVTQTGCLQVENAENRLREDFSG